jgi:putative ABC transport system permease protein
LLIVVSFKNKSKMYKNHLKIAFRNLLKNRFFTFLNIAGLSCGLACFALIGLNTVDEFTFDRFHVNNERIFRVLSTKAAGFRNGVAEKEAYQPLPLAPAMAAEFGDVEAYTRIRNWGGFVQSPSGLFEEGMDFVDADFLKVFSFKVLKGDAKTALDEPQEVVLTEKMAKKLFGYTDAVGQTIHLKVFDAFEPYIVSAVLADPPSNSSINLSIVLPFARYLASERGKGEINRWHRVSFPTYVLLREGSQLASKTDELQKIHARHFPEDESNARQKGWWSGTGSPFSYALQPLRDMRHDASVNITTVATSQIWTLFGIGILVLLIACANFTTLAIGRSAGRALETGVRKAMGASRRQLVVQHLLEAFLMSFTALGLGFLLAKITLPLFNQLIDKELTFSFRQFPELFWYLPLVGILTGLMAGAYPALVLSGFRPLDVFRKKMRLGGENLFTRSLVTGQFVLSVGLGICMLVMMQQIDFLRGKNLGFQKENVVVLSTFGSDDTEQTAELFHNELKKIPEVVKMSHAEMSLGGEAGQSVSGFEYKGKPVELNEYVVDTAYIPTLGLTVLAGRNFDAQVVADTQSSVIINEAAMQMLGWSLEDAVGQKLAGYDRENRKDDPIVIGVVKNYHFGSLHEEVKPMMLQQFSAFKRFFIFVRIEKGNPEKALAGLKNAWASAAPKLSFNYQFLDESLDTFYKAEQRWSKIVTLAGGLSMFLACLGLFGLAALAAVNRTKEIGIRKVLGASIVGITGLLAKDFLKLVLLAVVVASPIAYYLMQQWLADFAYRIDIQAWMFVVAGVGAALVAALTVSFQSVKAALANPVKALRSE